jgi:hypothetical protein
LARANHGTFLGHCDRDIVFGSASFFRTAATKRASALNAICVASQKWNLNRFAKALWRIIGLQEPLRRRRVF